MYKVEEGEVKAVMVNDADWVNSVICYCESPATALALATLYDADKIQAIDEMWGNEIKVGLFASQLEQV